MLDAPGADQDPERDEALIPPSQTDIEKVQPLGRSRFLGLQDRLERFEKSTRCASIRESPSKAGAA